MRRFTVGVVLALVVNSWAAVPASGQAPPGWGQPLEPVGQTPAPATPPRPSPPPAADRGDAPATLGATGGEGQGSGAQGAPTKNFWTPAQVRAVLENAATEMEQAPASEALGRMALGKGHILTGETVRRLPVDDVAATLGAWSGGDASDAVLGLQRLFVKVVHSEAAAVGTEAVVGGGIPPVAAAIVAAVVVDAAVNYGVHLAEVAANDLTETIRDLQAYQRGLNDRESEAFKLDLQILAGRMLDCHGQVAGVKSDLTKLKWDLQAGRTSGEEYLARSRGPREEYKKAGGRYEAVVKELEAFLAARVKSLEDRLAALREQYRRLNEKLEASGGQAAATSVEATEVFREYQQLEKQLAGIKRGPARALASRPTGGTSTAEKGGADAWSTIIVTVDNVTGFKTVDHPGWRRNGTDFSAQWSGGGRVSVRIDITGKGGVSYADYGASISVRKADGSPLLSKSPVISKDGGSTSETAEWDPAKDPGGLSIEATITGGNPDSFTYFVSGSVGQGTGRESR